MSVCSVGEYILRQHFSATIVETGASQAKQHMKRHLGSLVISDVQIKTMKYHLKLIRMATVEKTDNPSVC